MKYEIDNESPQKRKEYIKQLFNSIVPTYDLLNSFLSLKIDSLSRSFALKKIKLEGLALDLCCGTGDMTHRIMKLKGKIVSIDFSYSMLQSGAGKKWLYSPINGDVTVLPFKKNTFDYAIIAFGIRNIPDIDIFLKECNKVLKEKGELCIIELTRPTNFLIKPIYYFYLHLFLPFVGGIISGKFSAYRYLAKTISTFLDVDVLSLKLQENGFKTVSVYKKTFGIAHVIIAEKG